MLFCVRSLHREIQARGVSGWHCTVYLTDLQRLRAGTMNGLKSTQTSRASLVTDPTSSALEAPDVPSRQVTAGSLQVPGDGYGPSEPTDKRTSGTGDANPRQQPPETRTAWLPGGCGEAGGSGAVAAAPAEELQHPAASVGDAGRNLQGGAMLQSVRPASQRPGQELRGAPAVDMSQGGQTPDWDRAAAAATTQHIVHRALPSQASTVAYEGASTLPCTHDMEAGPSNHQVCLAFHLARLVPEN